MDFSIFLGIFHKDVSTQLLRSNGFCGQALSLQEALEKATSFSCDPKTKETKDHGC